MKQLKEIADKFANWLNFLHFQPLISGEAAASPASPVPTPLTMQKRKNHKKMYYLIKWFDKVCVQTAVAT